MKEQLLYEVHVPCSISDRRNARNDFQHKLSRQTVDDNQAVIVETLKVLT